MKKSVWFLIFAIILCTNVSVLAQNDLPALESIMGSGGMVVAENFSTKDSSDAPMFLDKSYLKNDTKSVPGWGMVAEGSLIEGIDITGLGEKEYQIPLSDKQLKNDVGMRISGTETGTKNAAVDVWNIPVENIRGADKYRIEYNVYIHNAELENPSGLISSVILYTGDIQGVDKAVGIVGFRRNGTVVKILDNAKNKQSEIKDENGKSVEFENDKWQHISIDVDAKNSTYTFFLNGKLLLENEKLSGAVNLHADSGTYRIRLSYSPFSGDAESFVVFDDVLFAKHVKSAGFPEFSKVVNGSNVSENPSSLFGLTDAIYFKNISGKANSAFALYEEGKAVPVTLADEKGELKVKPSALKARKAYTAKFNRFVSPDGKTFMAENLAIPFYCHTVSISDVTEKSLKICSSESTEAVISVTAYNENDEMVSCVFGEPIKLEAGKIQTVSVPEPLISGNSIKISVVESISNPRPLCAAVTMGYAGGAK